MSHLSKRQAREIKRDRITSDFAEESCARQYFEYARYETREHDKVELTASLIVGLLFAWLLGSGAWQSSLVVGLLAFFATLITIFLLHWIRAPSALYKRTMMELKKGKALTATDAEKQRRGMITARLAQFIKELPVTPPWVAIQTAQAGGGLKEIARIQGQRTQLIDFLEVHCGPEGVKRFENKGTRGLEELLAEFLKEEDKTKPNIKGEIEEVYDEWALPQVRSEGEEPQSALECFFTVKARIFNVHPIATTVRFELWVQAPLANCKAIKSSLSGLRLKRKQHATGTFVRMSKIEPVIEEMPDLQALGRTPLAQGDEHEGWLRFVLPKADNPIRKDIQSLRLVVKDVYGGEHTISSDRSEWRQTGEIVTLFDLEIERQMLEQLDTDLL